MEHLQPKAVGEVAGVRALAGAGGALQAEREAPLTGFDESVGEGREVDVRGRECGVERHAVPLRGLFAAEHAGQAAHAPAHQLESAVTEVCRRRRAGRHPGCGVELVGQGLSVLDAGLNAAAG